MSRLIGWQAGLIGSRSGGVELDGAGRGVIRSSVSWPQQRWAHIKCLLVLAFMSTSTGFQLLSILFFLNCFY